jgi:hypothetical protein
MEACGVFGKLAIWKPVKRKKKWAWESACQFGPSTDGVRRRCLRVLDRECDRYEETVIDEKSGDTIYQIVEPLTCHRNRGSAKRKTYQTAVEWAMDTMVVQSF